MTGWTTPRDIADKIRRRWNDGSLLTAPLRGESLFPLRLTLRHPDSEALLHRFSEALDWQKQVEAGSRLARGFGYDIEWKEIRHRQLGRNRIAAAVTIPTEDDALALIGMRREGGIFRTLAARTLERFPGLKEWILRRPLKLVEHAADWDKVLAVVDWFRSHPASGLYMRQVDIPGVGTKFIEGRKGLLRELLDALVPDGSPDAEERAPMAAVGQGNAKTAATVSADDASGKQADGKDSVERDSRKTTAFDFEARFGLRTKPVLLRFRLLDAAQSIGGLTDLSAPVDQIANLPLDMDHVFITENEINGLAFPPIPRSLVLFGLGYGVESLAGLPWLAHKTIHYWGDIDTHGFAMLDRLRRFLPDARSLLMDRETLMAHRDQWVEEPVPARKDLERLTVPERELFQDLVSDRLGTRVRLEQERIAYGWALNAISRSRMASSNDA